MNRYDVIRGGGRGNPDPIYKIIPLPKELHNPWGVMSKTRAEKMSAFANDFYNKGYEVVQFLISGSLDNEEGFVLIKKITSLKTLGKDFVGDLRGLIKNQIEESKENQTDIISVFPGVTGVTGVTGRGPDEVNFLNQISER